MIKSLLILEDVNCRFRSGNYVYDWFSVIGLDYAVTLGIAAGF